jgi:NADH-quinone oxidoreductase subunit H
MYIAILIIQVLLAFHIAVGLASLATWFERKASALLQDRIGANRAGAFFYPEDITLRLQGVLPRWLLVILRIALVLPMLSLRVLGVLGVINTLFCDAVKAIFKEDFVPKGVSNFIHCLGPFMAVFPIFVAFAMIPFAPEFLYDGYVVKMQVAPIDAGLLFLFAMGSVAVYGVAIAGWSGNNKFSLFGGLRAAAQMVSYELAMGLSFVTMIALYATLDLYTMIEVQSGAHPYLPFLPNWGIFYQPLCFVVLFIVGMAETKRAPFDLPEAESELAAGYFTEYSGMKFLLFWLGEFAEIALFAFLIAILFFGGWDIPYVDLERGTFLTAAIGFVVLITKVIALMLLQIIIRWTLPRFRYDQLMNLGWKILLPVSMVNLVITGVLIVAF